MFVDLDRSPHDVVREVISQYLCVLRAFVVKHLPKLNLQLDLRQPNKCAWNRTSAAAECIMEIR